jgi:hypothetical protein
METEQLIFEEVVLEAEDRHRAAQDELRQDVQDWFDALPSRVKDVLGAWVDGSTQYDALVALSAAAGDYNRRRMEMLRHMCMRSREDERREV